MFSWLMLLIIEQSTQELLDTHNEIQMLETEIKKIFAVDFFERKMNTLQEEFQTLEEKIETISSENMREIQEIIRPLGYINSILMRNLK